VNTEPNPAQMVTAGSSQRVGHYHYDILNEAWEWDDEVYRIHGYEPGAVDVDTNLISAHKHPDDRDNAAGAIAPALLHGEPFSVYQRIITADGSVRNVVVLGAGIVDDKLDVVALDGFVMDLTPDVRRQEQTAADEAVTASAEHRAAIEQAKGMIMLSYGIDEVAAFAMLRWWSMEANIKLHLLAERLVDAGAAQQVTNPDVRLRVDRLLRDIAANPDM
jgi:ANTAR domain/PAS fold